MGGVLLHSQHVEGVPAYVDTGLPIVYIVVLEEWLLDVPEVIDDGLLTLRLGDRGHLGQLHHWVCAELPRRAIAVAGRAEVRSRPQTIAPTDLTVEVLVDQPTLLRRTDWVWRLVVQSRDYLGNDNGQPLVILEQKRTVIIISPSSSKYNSELRFFLPMVRCECAGRLASWTPSRWHLPDHPQIRPQGWLSPPSLKWSVPIGLVGGFLRRK